MKSLDLKRKKIRNQFSEILSDSEKFTCSTSASKRLSASELPIVRVQTPESDEDYLGGPPSYYGCKTKVLVSVTATDSLDPESVLDDLAEEAHRHIIEKFPSADVNSLKRIKTRTEFKEGGSDIIGNIDLWYELTYTVKEEKPAKDLKKYKGTLATFGAQK